jgi:hypothetical protein
MKWQAEFWHKQHGLEEARSEALRAVGLLEKLGDTEGMEYCRKLLRQIEEDELVTSSRDDNGEFLEIVRLPTPAKSPFSARGIE